MNRMNDPIENAVDGFRAGVSDGRTEKQSLQPWAKGALYFCLIVAVVAGGLVLYSQLTQ